MYLVDKLKATVNAYKFSSELKPVYEILCKIIH